MVKVVAWSTSTGATFETAKVTSWYWGETAPFEVTTSGGLLPPASLSRLEGLTIIVFPEPSVAVLATAGATILLLGRRKRARTAAPSR